MFEKEREMKMEKARKKKSGDEGREITHERWRYRAKRMQLTNDNHLDVLGTANEKVAEQVSEGHDVEGRAPPTQQRHRGN